VASGLRQTTRITVISRAKGQGPRQVAACGSTSIIMGSRERGDLAGLVLGSTTHKVIHLAGRPVLVAR
jgi:nucleotide-binding universal stress UspA family protein